MARLVADIGGTNCRFAFVGDDGRILDARTLRVADFPGPVEAARAYLGERVVEDAVLAVATPVEDDLVALTNSPWRFSQEAVREALGLRRFAAINDFVAQALAVPRLGPDDLIRIGGGEPLPGRSIAVIGPGTGLGVSALIPTREGWLPLASEGGHVSFAPGSDEEVAVLQALRSRWGHVSAERVISGPGLLEVAHALALMRGIELRLERPEDVTARAAGDCAVCLDTVRLFLGALGGVAGDLALTVLARGGVYICGGICRRLGPLLDHELLRARFEAKGRFRELLGTIPIFVTTRSGMGLIGAAAYGIETGRG
jgi:glucokinase